MAQGATTYDFTGSTVLVTGGGTGIGLGITQAFLAAGANVVITGRRKDKLDEALRGADPARTEAIAADIGDGQQVRELIDRVVNRFGALDVVISNAAGYANGPLTELEDADWESMRSANIDGFFHLAKAALPRLAESGGNLVAVSSVSGLRGDWGQAGYNATKAAVSNFVRSLALDWGPRGVRLNAVAPAFTVTDATRPFAEDEALLPRFVNRTALGRVGQPADIAPAVLFLASSAAAYVTGVILPVDGGTSASSGQVHL
ncbi:MAG TPA: SDR family oxidoreductase [Pseudonocardia sp.]|nr:SDR family oxidoreductase [Pseudonocardia sp.]